MVTLIVTRGLPASGKSTWSRKIVETFPGTHIRVNRDDIRNMLGQYWVPKREKVVSRIEKEAIVAGLEKGYNVIIDATNLNPKTMAKWESLAYEYKVELTVKDFTDVSVAECLTRDKLREASVGREVILEMATKYLGYGN